MNQADARKYHRLFGAKQSRAVYHKWDFIDYVVMCLLTGAVLALAYGPRHPVALVGYALCLIMPVSFAIRHGIKLKVPLILRRPQDVLYMVAYKILNIKPVWFIAVTVLAAENLFIYLTPTWPHHTELMRTIGLYAFYIHLIGLTVYRTIILIAHLQKTELAREVLMQTAWRKVVNEKTNMAWEVFHAYFTGLLTHITLIAPWYMVIVYAKFSVLAIPVVFVLNFLTHGRWLKEFNSWFYRDHWLGHSSEFDFIYLHGPHHDAIPSGLIGVSGNGYLEGFFRHTIAAPHPFYNPVFALLMYSIDVKSDIDLHQYIPGIFPKLGEQDLLVIQHSTHHYGRLEPYGFGTRFDRPGVTEEYKKKFKSLPVEVTNSIQLDEELNGFEWDNPTYRQTMALFQKYHNS